MTFRPLPFLIAFLAVCASTSRALEAIRLSKDGQIYLNREGVTKADYPRRLTEIMNTAAPELVFFAASGELHSKLHKLLAGALR